MAPSIPAGRTSGCHPGLPVCARSIVIGVLLIIGCARDASESAAVAVDTALGAYMSIPEGDRGPRDAAAALDALARLGPAGIPGIYRLLSTLSPSLADSGLGPEWQENVLGYALDAIAHMEPAALPVVLDETRSSSGPVRAFAYFSLTRMELDGRDPEIQLAVERGIDDAQRGVRAAAVHLLGKLELPAGRLLASLRRACDANDDDDVKVACFEAMGELGLRDATPFLLSVARDNYPAGNDRLLTGALTALALLEVWDLEDALVDLARRSTVDRSSFDFYQSSGPVARWALARKAGYGFPRYTPGCDLADVWWKLEGRRRYDLEAELPRVDFGSAVNGLAVGIMADSTALVAREWFRYDTVFENRTDSPMRLVTGAPMGGGPGANCKPRVTFTTAHGPGSWSMGGAGSSVAVVTLPPGGIAGVPSSLYPFGFSPEPTPGDLVKLVVEYAYQREAEDPQGVWEGSAISGSLNLTVHGE